jgi:hypothetical protein
MNVRSKLIWWTAPCLVGITAFFCSDLEWAYQARGLLSLQPVIVCQTSIHLGEQERGKVVAAQFQVANAGREKLVLSGIRADCACSGLERLENGIFVRPQEIVIKPNETAELLVRLAVRGPHGQAVRHRVSFVTNDPTQPEVHVDVVIDKVIGGIEASPSALLFHDVIKGGVVSRVITLRDRAIRPRAITHVATSNPSLYSVKVLHPERNDHVEPGVVGSVEVTLTAREVGSANATLLVYIEGTKQPDEVPIRGRVTAAVTASPDVVYFPRWSSQGPLFTATCWCQGMAGPELVLQPIRFSDHLQVSIREDGDNHTRKVVNISVKPGREEDQDLSGEVVLRGEAGGHQVELTILVRHRRLSTPGIR